MAQYVATAVRVTAYGHGVRVIGRDHNQRVLPAGHVHCSLDRLGQHDRFVDGHVRAVLVVRPIDVSALHEQIVPFVALVG